MKRREPEIPAASLHKGVFPERLYSLDALRGVASLAVVFWHWQHFFYDGPHPAGFDPAGQPFHEWLSILYSHGGLGVPIFFALSGFVFFWLYSGKLADRSVSLDRFAVDRFSRLYPLHLVTMAGVLALQAIYWKAHGSYFVYPFNDAYHGLLNLLLIPAWGFEKGWSYNAPVWSVSIEAMLYILFAVCCLLGRVRLVLCVVLLILGFMLLDQHYKVATGLRMFFAGGLAWAAADMAIHRLGKRPAAFLFGFAAGALWLSVAIFGAGAVPWELVFPVTIAALACAGTIAPDLLKEGAWLGDISYSTYLLHFPLQIVFVLVFDALGFSRNVFREEWVLVLFVASLLAVSHACYRLLEIPMKQWLRGVLITDSRLRSA